MVIVRVSSRSFELTPWIKTHLEKKSRRLENYSSKEVLYISWRLLKQKDYFETRLIISKKRKSIHLVSRSEDFKSTIDYLIERAEIELATSKRKKRGVKKRKRELFIEVA